MLAVLQSYTLMRRFQDALPRQTVLPSCVREIALSVEHDLARITCFHYEIELFFWHPNRYFLKSAIRGKSGL